MELISQSSTSLNSSFEVNALSVVHSFGYECNKYFNLSVMDEHTLVYCSGNFIHMFDTRTGEVQLRRSAEGCGLGHAVKNPKYPHLAVGEKGDKPPIIIYEWPSFKVVNILNEGTSHSFVHLGYSPDGEILCSQGGKPDYLLTLWDWYRCYVIVRTTSYETYNVEFSRYKSEHLTSCGIGHIKLWQMSSTYTGLKLRSVQGKFGTTEVCNVISLYSMPDLKVLSGCSWGNILVWQNGSIFLEIIQQGGRPCHTAPVAQIEYNQQFNEFITIGMDGWIKQWSYKPIEMYDPMEGDGQIVMKSFFEISVRDIQGTAKLLSMVKKNCDPNDFIWFAQDGNGGLWEVDIEVSATAAPPKRLYSCHSTAVVALVPSPAGHYIATLAQSGVLHVYNADTKKLEAFGNFNCSGSALIWLPKSIISWDNIIIAGFGDGTLRVCVVHISKSLTINCVKVIQIIKPHNMRVTSVTVYNTKQQLICGSEDSTCFIFKINPVLGNSLLEPIGYLQLAGQIVNFSWNMDKKDKMLIVCKELMYIATMTGISQPDITSYKLNIPLKSIQVNSVQRQSQSETGIKNEIKPILFAQYTSSGTVWLSMAELLFEYDVELGKCLRQCCIADAYGTEVHSFIETLSGQFKIISLSNGSIRVVKTNCDDFLDMSNYWQLSIHDNDNGIVPSLCLSQDEKYLYSCGHDGNVFVYSLDFILDEVKLTSTLESVLILMPDDVNECDEIPVISLEEDKKNSQISEQMKGVMQRKNEVQNKIKELKERFDNLIYRNSILPPSQRLPRSDFKLDNRIKMNIRDLIKRERDLVRRKINFDLEKSQMSLQKLKNYFLDSLAAFSVEISAIRERRTVTTFTHKALGSDFETCEKETKELVNKFKAPISNDTMEVLQKPIVDTLMEEIPESLKMSPVEPFLQSTQDIYHKLNIKTRRALDRYLISKKKKEERKKQWEDFMKTQPNREETLVSDMIAIEKAQKTIGAYKLKSDPSYKVTDVFSLSSLYKFNQLLSIKREIFTMKEDFNHKVYTLRNDKVELMKKYKQLKYDLKTVQKELSQEDIKTPPAEPQLNIPSEFPERKFQINPGKEPGTDLQLIKKHDEEFEVLYTGRSDSTTDVDETSEERELKCLRVGRKLYEQDQILLNMNKAIEHFDKSVKQLCREKVNISIDIKYLEIFLLVVHQELVVIQRYDEIEESISEKVEKSLAEKHTKLLKINILQHKLGTKTQEIRQCEQKVLELEMRFKALIAGSEAEKYLTRVYKKKYKPPLLNSDSEISESSSSEDASECSAEETARKQVRLSIVSAQDVEENLDKVLYNQTIELRRQRHSVEAEITKLKKLVEQLKKDHDNHSKTLKIIEPVLRINQEQFETIQKEKHNKINEMETLVLLNCSQLQNFNKQQSLEPVNRTLLMSTATIQDLRNRVTQLDKETEVELMNLKKNQKYQTRINEESKELEGKITTLKKESHQVMIRKFGREIDIDNLEEVVLRNIVSKVRSDLQEEKLKREFESKISNLKASILTKSEELADLKRENTEKLQVLSTLEEEKEFLTKLLHQTEIQKVKLSNNNTDIEYNKDIRKLTHVLQSLRLQKETLIHEIKVLSLKGRPLPPITDSPRKSIPSLSLGDVQFKESEQELVQKQDKVSTEELNDEIKEDQNTEEEIKEDENLDEEEQ